MELKLRLIRGSFAVCRLPNTENIPDWALTSDFFSITRTDDELSVVVSENVVPAANTCEKNWIMFRVEGILDFGLIGILSKLSTLLAQQGISIFALSTYNTDYILVKSKDRNASINAFESNGIKIVLG